jgi:LPXTG-motif cell wall-anchored protein
MTEDKKIEVTFTEATISVPITGKNSNILAILAVLVIIGATVILLHPKKKKKLIIER